MMKQICILLAFATGLLQAQFAEVTVAMDVQRLNDRERQELQGLEEAISQFFISSPWEEEVADLEMFLDINLVFQSTLPLGNEVYYQAQVVLTNRQDQRFFIRDANFPFSPGRSITLSPLFEPLSSLLEFYAYLLIAGELDTYTILAGSAYYTKAISLAVQGESDPQLNRGWSDRRRLAERLAANQELRRAKAYFYQAFDTLAKEEPKLEDLRKALTLFHKSIYTVVEREGQDRYMSVFLSGHAEEIAEMLAMAGMWTELADMKILNPDSERIYQSYLEGGSSK